MNMIAVATYMPLIDETSRDFLSALLDKGGSGQVALDPKRMVLETVLDLTMTVNYGSRRPKEPGLFEEIMYIEDRVASLDQ